MATSACYENPPAVSSNCGAGTVQELGGLQTYLTGPFYSKLAILLVSDVFGTNSIQFLHNLIHNCLDYIMSFYSVYEEQDSSTDVVWMGFPGYEAPNLR